MSGLASEEGVIKPSSNSSSSSSICSCTKEELLRDVAGSKVIDTCPLCNVAIGLHRSAASLQTNTDPGQDLGMATPLLAPGAQYSSVPAYYPAMQQPVHAVAAFGPSSMVRINLNEGNYYIGEVNPSGRFHGQGKKYRVDGTPYAECQLWKNGQMTGNGYWIFMNGDRWDGNYDGVGTFSPLNGPPQYGVTWQQMDDIKAAQVRAQSGGARPGAALAPPPAYNHVPVVRPLSCENHILEPEFNALGIFLGVVFFPIGLVCCFVLRDERCTRCGQVFQAK